MSNNLFRIVDHCKSLLFRVRGRGVPDTYAFGLNAGMNAVDIFKDEWIGGIPGRTDLVAGKLKLYEDSRLKWANEVLCFSGKSVLELGPLEGSHSFMLQQFGARNVVAVEGNTRAFMKCLIVKELAKLHSVEFLCQDFDSYFSGNVPKFDICLASGVLYHSKNPLKLISDIAKCAQSVVLWTQYYDPEVMKKKKDIAYRFSSPTEISHDGYSCNAYRRDYGVGIYSKLSCGGCDSYSYWLTRDVLLDALTHYGFVDQKIGNDDSNHQNGPCITLIASKKH